MRLRGFVSSYLGRTREGGRLCHTHGHPSNRKTRESDVVIVADLPGGVVTLLKLRPRSRTPVL